MFRRPVTSNGIVYPRAHFMPTASEYLDPLISFVAFTTRYKEDSSHVSTRSSEQAEFLIRKDIEEELTTYL